MNLSEAMERVMAGASVRQASGVYGTYLKKEDDGTVWKYKSCAKVSNHLTVMTDDLLAEYVIVREPVLGDTVEVSDQESKLFKQRGVVNSVKITDEEVTFVVHMVDPDNNLIEYHCKLNDVVKV